MPDVASYAHACAHAAADDTTLRAGFPPGRQSPIFCAADAVFCSVLFRRRSVSIFTASAATPISFFFLFAPAIFSIFPSRFLMTPLFSAAEIVDFRAVRFRDYATPMASAGR
jgi:hypothetical protein